MKHFYFLTLAALLGASSLVSSAANHDQAEFARGRFNRFTLQTESPDAVVNQVSQQAKSMQITDFDNQVKGRYYCEYYSPLIWPETNEPFGWCAEQPMIVEDYFALNDGDVNIGYLFFVNAILKGNVDVANGTITIPSRKVLTYYEDPDDYDDPGMPVHFVTVDVADGRYVANYERPFVGTFELHHGKITKITTNDRWGYVVKNNAGQEVGWFEIAENSTFYLGHGEMEYYPGDINGDGVIDSNDKEQTVVHAVSDGKKAVVYNAFRSGWENPIEIEVDGSTAIMRSQSVTVGGKTLVLADESDNETVIGRIRDITWDEDRRDPMGNAAMSFGTVHAVDKAAGSTVMNFENVRFFFKEDVAEDSSGVDDVAIENADTAPAVYYNLQGVRVENPRAGIFIRSQGGKTAKVAM